MAIFSYHLVQLSFLQALKTLVCPPKSKNINGLIHAETMSVMTLGSSIFHPSRFYNREIAVFAQWENQADLTRFLEENKLGKQLIKGWYTTLQFVRQWGTFSGFQIPTNTEIQLAPETPVVAVTVARMKFLQIPRFLKWGRPVEKLVRDHAGTTLSLASIHYPRTISTFSIWNSQKEMQDMVHGHSSIPQPKRHIDAMKERNRKDFHLEFTTLRFLATGEFGTWKGKSQYLPKNQIK